MSSIKTIQQRIRDKAEVAAIKDLECFANAVAQIPLANRFFVNYASGRAMSMAYAASRRSGNETSYNELKEQLTNEYVEKYTAELMAKLEFAEEYFKGAE